MRYTIYPVNKSKLRLKRSQSKTFLLPVLLVVPVLLLSLFSLHQHFSSPQDAAEAPKVQAAASSDSSGPQEAAAGNKEPAGSESQAPAASPSGDDSPELTAPEKQSELRVVKASLQRGDTLSSILKDHLNPSEIYLLSRRCRDVYSMNRLKSGHQYRLLFRDDRLTGFEYDIDADEKLKVDLSGEEYTACREAIEYDTRQKLIQNTISTSLFEAVDEVGESPALAIALAEIFAWDVDFIRDVRQGDSFKLIVSKRYRQGKFAGYGPIKAARFTNSGQEYSAFYYATKDGRQEYFTPEGEAVRKTFLKAPLNFTRISSGYTWRRKHPVLNVVRPHLGIDYAAPTGTPIKSVADGEIITRSRTREAGRYVKVRHPNGYVTVYNHMSRFARGVSRGKNVNQGDTLGYVGSTGLSTGPHLDYRVKKNGRYINPLKIDSKPVKPIPDSELARFKQSIQPMLAVLDGNKPLLAQLETEGHSGQ